MQITKCARAGKLVAGFAFGASFMGDLIQFRTKRLTGFIPDDEQRSVGEGANRAFWLGPEQTNARLFADTAPSEMQMDSGDCGE